MFTVDRIVSSYHHSNAYVLGLCDDQIIVIDPGDPNIATLKSLTIQINKNISAVVLTHEHSDHCSGVNPLYAQQPFDLICTEACGKNISHNKQNFSFYIEEINTFEINIPFNPVRDFESLSFNGRLFTFVATPGHSPGSMCIITGNSVFTGDTLLNNIKTPLTFPHSNRKHYAESIEKLNNLLKPGMMVYPGHGDAFEWKGF